MEDGSHDVCRVEGKRADSLFLVVAGLDRRRTMYPA